MTGARSSGRAVPDPYVPERGDDGWVVDHTDLDLDYSIPSNRLDGRARITCTAMRDLTHLDLDLVGLRVAKVEVDGRAARHRHAGPRLRVQLPAAAAAGQHLEVAIRYTGNPSPTGSTWGPVGWEELDDGVLVASQPSGACTWFPCNDLPAQKGSFDVRIRASSTHRVVVNGVLESATSAGSTTTWHYVQAEPTSPYLMTVHVGRSVQRSLTGGPVPMEAIHPAGAEADVDRAFARQGEMLEAFIHRFGPYPFAAPYAVVVCPEELEVPLEAQGQSIFGANHLDGRHERLIAHELAHQWFGNSLTAARWSDIWLHEGFACYAEWLWSEDSGGDPASRHAARHHARLADQPQDLLLIDPGPEDMFDDRVYKRGALALHALRVELGDDAFGRLLRRWTTEHRNGVVTTAAFQTTASAVAGRDLSSLFDAWLRDTRLPPLPDPEAA